MKRILLSLCIGLSVLCLAACGSDKDKEPVEETAAEPIADTKDEVVEEVEEAVVETAPEWVEAYKAFLSDHSNFYQLLTEEYYGPSGYITGFFLYDMNNDDIPELFVNKYFNCENIYVFSNGSVELRESIVHDEVTEYHYGYTDETGMVYDFISDAGTDVSRATSLAKLTLPEEKSKDEFVFDYEVEENIYNATWGEIEGAEGNYFSVEWENAMRDEENSKISDVEFYSIVERLNPFIYKKITEENIKKYVIANYKETDMYEEMNIHDYIEILNKEISDYASTKYQIDLNNVEVVEREHYPTTYISIDDLCCYTSDMVIIQGEDWRTAYYDEIQKNYSDYIKEYTAYCFAHIDDDDIPECLVYIGDIGEELGGIVFTIHNNEVKAIDVCPYCTNIIYMLKPKGNVFCTDYAAQYRTCKDFYSLQAGEFKDLDSLEFFFYDDANSYSKYDYSSNEMIDISEAEYNEIIASYGDFVEVNYDDFSPSIMEAKVLQ